LINRNEQRPAVREEAAMATTDEIVEAVAEVYGFDVGRASAIEQAEALLADVRLDRPRLRRDHSS
jgi:hypothetical protein